MSPETAGTTRADRNAALVEVMLLAAMADGKLTEGSIQALLRRVLERPEFDGTRPEEISELVEKSVKRLASESTLESILQRLRDRLPTHQNRLLAFGLALPSPSPTTRPPGPSWGFSRPSRRRWASPRTRWPSWWTWSSPAGR
jgi:hypothetical protein